MPALPSKPDPKPSRGRSGGESNHYVSTAGASGERRTMRDRRRKPTPMFSRYTFFGRRRRNRRATDPRQRYYVDWVSGPYLYALIGILTLILIDAFSTLHIIHSGGGEANPLMRWVLGHGAGWFVATKALTALLGFVFLAVHRFFPVARTMVTLLLGAYGGVVFYHVVLLLRIHL